MSQRPDWTSHHRLLPVIALGGAIGAAARYLLEEWWPTPAGDFPWSTLVVNSSGCLFIGALMVLLVEGGASHPVVRPFVGVGILGGFTTFSTYAVQAVGLLDEEPATAAAYLLVTLVGALAAVLVGITVARASLAARRRLTTLRREST